MSDRKTPPPEKLLPGEATQMNARAMKAFAHPLRMAMYSYLSDHGSATSTMLARRLDESTGQTSYHLRQLEKLGLVEEDAGRGAGRERWWKPIGYSLRQEVLGAGSDRDEQANVLLEHQLQDRMEKMRGWLLHDHGESEEWTTASVDSTSTATMTVEQMDAMTRELMEVIDRHTTTAESSAVDKATASRRVRVYLSTFPLTDDE